MKRMMFAVLACLAAMMPSKLIAKDVALLIANVGSLDVRDPQVINRELGSLISAYQDDGYSVLFEREVNNTRVLEAVRQFEATGRTADRMVVHFIGKVAETRQSLFLLPAGAVGKSIADLHSQALDVEMLYDLLSARPGRSALIIGTTTDRVMEKLQNRGHIPQGVLVLVADALTMNRSVQQGLLEGDETGRQMGQRTGVGALGFVSDFTLTPRSVSVAPQPQRTAADEALVEMQVWREAARNGSREALQGYVNRYPNGLFRGEAQARLVALAPPKPVEQTVEENLNLSRADRRNVQKNLTLLGFDTRGVDGVLGRGSRSAIERWQRTEGFRVTGYLDRAQIRVLNETAAARAEADRLTRERDDLAYWQQTGSGTNERGLRDYLAKYPKGLFATQATQALARITANSQPKQDEAAIQREKALKMNGKTRALVEQRLVGLGYDVGPADGTFTRETRIAIRAFQQKAGIKPTGYMDNQTVTRLVASIFR